MLILPWGWRGRLGKPQSQSLWGTLEGWSPSQECGPWARISFWHSVFALCMKENTHTFEHDCDCDCVWEHGWPVCAQVELIKKQLWRHKLKFTRPDFFKPEFYSLSHSSDSKRVCALSSECVIVGKDQDGARTLEKKWPCTALGLGGLLAERRRFLLWVGSYTLLYQGWQKHLLAEGQRKEDSKGVDLLSP
jgi:hypothetical protein